MPRLDLYHHAVKRALQKDHWTITHDPFLLQIGTKRLFADLGAECLISAEKGLKKIVVEVKSFLGKSDVKELQQAVGQYIMYQQIIQKTEPERLVYLAVSAEIFKSVFTVELGQLFLINHLLRLLVVNMEEEVIIEWIPA
ncbi:MAG: fatty-acid synthase [Thiotrichaceae bacterium IS1]|nr:MAG: fatty-acid synthase [Thiotrichaceae bacterium IS1]